MNRLLCSRCRVYPVRRPGPMRAFSTDVAFQSIQSGMVALQNASGAPWWATIAMSTLVVRSSLLPLVRFQINASRKLSSALPEVNFLFKLLQSRLKHIPSSDARERRKVISVFFKGVKACFVLHEVNLVEIIFYPVVNIATFLTFVLSVRDLVITAPASVGLEDGGAFWFKDLSDKDRSFVLPAMAVALSYGAIEMALGSNQGRLLMVMKDVFQSGLLLSIPMLSSLPAGVFCYWIPSTLFGIFQSQALKNQKILQLLRLPPLKKR